MLAFLKMSYNEGMGQSWSDPSIAPSAPFPYEPRDALTQTHIEIWQRGWRHGWAQGVNEEAALRKIHKAKLKEIAECIAVLDDPQWSEERALNFLRAVFFPNVWDRWSHWLLRQFRIIRKKQTTAGKGRTT